MTTADFLASTSMAASHVAPPVARVRYWALLPCAGSGSRAMGPGCSKAQASARPKQYHPVAGQPMVLHTLSAFGGVARLAGTLVAVAPGDHFLHAYADPTYFVVDCGGATRADTVLAGLQALLNRGALVTDWVLVHDAARCLVTSEQINRLIDVCSPDPVGGLLGYPLADTLKTSLDGPGGIRVASTVDRSNKWLAQTPQMFHIGALADALVKVGNNVTDEASAMEAMGHHPRLVSASAQNFKVTYPDDFALAEAVLLQRGHGTTLARFGGAKALAVDAAANGLGD